MARIHVNEALESAIRLHEVSMSMNRVSRRGGRTARQRLRRLAGDESRRRLQVYTGLSLEIPVGAAVAVVPGSKEASVGEFMRLCSGTLLPDRGRVEVRDPVVPMLPKSGLLNESLTVRQNIYVAGILLGMSPQQVADSLAWIVSFAGLERSLDVYARKAPPRLRQRIVWTVTMATRSRSFAIQGALAVGDEAFRRQCWEYLLARRQDGVTFLVDDSDANLIRFCDRALLLLEGRVEPIESVAEALARRVEVHEDRVQSRQDEADDEWQDE
ncbi:MAG: hypothetical protein KGP12_01565 [Actinomycetales bacterium]|nr:hypothetical protein [Actinomycetales bacterium]